MGQIDNSKKIEFFSQELHRERDPAHDFSHIRRLLKLCKKLMVSIECDAELLIVSAYFHGALNQENKIRDFLRSLGYSNNFIDKIINVVRNSASPSTSKTMEEKILYDANLLDALGAVGIARSFIKGGYMGQSIQETLSIMKENMKRKLMTPEGESIAVKRRRFMDQFIRTLEEELRDII